jgi:hypothetical protein
MSAPDARQETHSMLESLDGWRTREGATRRGNDRELAQLCRLPRTSDPTAASGHRGRAPQARCCSAFDAHRLACRTRARRRGAVRWGRLVGELPSLRHRRQDDEPTQPTVNCGGRNYSAGSTCGTATLYFARHASSCSYGIRRTPQASTSQSRPPSPRRANSTSTWAAITSPFGAAARPYPRRQP